MSSAVESGQTEHLDATRVWNFMSGSSTGQIPAGRDHTHTHTHTHTDTHRHTQKHTLTHTHTHTHTYNYSVFLNLNPIGIKA